MTRARSLFARSQRARPTLGSKIIVRRFQFHCHSETTLHPEGDDVARSGGLEGREEGAPPLLYRETSRGGDLSQSRLGVRAGGASARLTTRQWPSNRGTRFSANAR